ncbi:MAG TPA: monovalent cation/H+ antiporter complex subunit F [Longimicrobiales bacterium]
MNAWLVGAAVLMLALLPCAWVCLRGRPMDRLVGLEMTGVVLTLLLLLLAEGFHRIPFFDLALALGILQFGAGLVFTRFLERWL